MAAYWMDLSISAEEVMSAVVICNHCKHRTIEASKDDASDWIVKHHYKFHYGESYFTKQVGDIAPRKPRTVATKPDQSGPVSVHTRPTPEEIEAKKLHLLELVGQGTNSYAAIWKSSGQPESTAYRYLKMLEDEGRLKREGRKWYVTNS